MRPERRSGARLRAGIVAVACLALAACAGDTGNTEAAATTGNAAADEPAAEAAMPDPDAGSAPVGRPPSAPLNLGRISREQRAKELLDAYACQSAERCGFEAFSASTPEEAAWMAMRGYPSAVRSEELERMSLNELELASERNDLAARAVLGRRLFEEGDIAGGYERLLGAANQGSVYADYELSRVKRTRSLVESAAYLRRAYLQGDTKAATEMYVRFPRLSVIEWNAVDRQAMRLYDSLLKERARQGRGRMPYGPRP